jgi:hypothetical protein
MHLQKLFFFIKPCLLVEHTISQYPFVGVVTTQHDNRLNLAILTCKINQYTMHGM